MICRNSIKLLHLIRYFLFNTGKMLIKLFKCDEISLYVVNCFKMMKCTFKLNTYIIIALIYKF